MTEHRNDFEERLRAMLAKAEKVVIPPLTSERLASLRALIPDVQSVCPSLTLTWKKLVNDVRHSLVVTAATGLNMLRSPAPVFRDGAAAGAHIETIGFPLQNGEMQAQIIPLDNCKAKVLLSVKGNVAERNDLSVELALGQKLIEARPLEQKAEVTLHGTGFFKLSIFSGETPLGSMNMNIGIEKDPDHA